MDKIPVRPSINVSQHVFTTHSNQSRLTYNKSTPKEHFQEIDQAMHMRIIHDTFSVAKMVCTKLEPLNELSDDDIDHESDESEVALCETKKNEAKSQLPEEKKAERTTQDSIECPGIPPIDSQAMFKSLIQGISENYIPSLLSDTRVSFGYKKMKSLSDKYRKTPEYANALGKIKPLAATYRKDPALFPRNFFFLIGYRKEVLNNRARGCSHVHNNM